MLVLYALLLPVIVLFCGLSLDVGLLELRQLQLQNAADAAALGAQMEAERGTGTPAWTAEGLGEAAANGFTNGANNVTVTVAQQPAAGPYAGDYDAIQATVTQTVQTIFLGAFNGGKFTLSAQAVALMTPCVYLTGTGSLEAYTLEVFTGSLNADSCPIWVNTSMEVTAWGKMAVNAIDVSGSSGSSIQAGLVYPGPVFNYPVQSDPLAATASPSFSACDHTSYSVSNTTKTLSPGTYCKGLNFTNSTVTLNPGLYIVTGGATWSNSTVTGSGVTLFFTTGGGGSYGQFLIQNSSNIGISAPNDSSAGGIPAILVFADRNWVHTSAQDFQIISSTFSGDGIWYLTNAGLNVWSSGTVTGPHYMGIVADNIFTGGTILTPTNNYSYVKTGNPFRPGGGLVQ